MHLQVSEVNTDLSKMGPPGRVFFVCAAVVVLQGCLVTEGIVNYAKVSKKNAEVIADNAYCLSQAAYSVIAAITPVSEHSSPLYIRRQVQ